MMLLLRMQYRIRYEWNWAQYANSSRIDVFAVAEKVPVNLGEVGLASTCPLRGHAASTSAMKIR